MARLLSKEPCKLTLHDNISDSTIVFSYRMPTTKERMDYNNGMIQRTKKGIEFKTSEVRQKFGAKILIDIREGDFQYDDDGEIKTLTSDNPEWKAMVCDMASDLIELLAAHAFESSAEIIANEDAEKN